MRDVNKADFAEAFVLLQEIVDISAKDLTCWACGAIGDQEHGPECLVLRTRTFLARFHA
jgi:hypothetical protein